jgi:hypothetical protein
MPPTIQQQQQNAPVMQPMLAPTLAPVMQPLLAPTMQPMVAPSMPPPVMPPPTMPPPTMPPSPIIAPLIPQPQLTSFYGTSSSPAPVYYAPAPAPILPISDNSTTQTGLTTFQIVMIVILGLIVLILVFGGIYYAFYSSPSTVVGGVNGKKVKFSGKKFKMKGGCGCTAAVQGL